MTPRRGITDAAGLAPVAVPAVDGALVRVDHPDFGPWVEVRTREQRTARVRLDPGHSILGRVTFELPARRATKSETLGTACATWVPELATTLAVSAPGYHAERVRVARPPDGEEPLVVRLRPAEQVIGVILGDDGLALDGAVLLVEQVLTGGHRRDEHQVEGETGDFRFDLPGPGRFPRPGRSGWSATSRSAPGPRSISSPFIPGTGCPWRPFSVGSLRPSPSRRTAP